MVGPSPPAPVRHGEGVGGVQHILILTYRHLTLGPEAVNLLVEVEMSRFVKWGADHHGLLRLLCQLHIGIQALPAPKAVHVGVESPPLLLPAEKQRVAPSGGGAVPLRCGGGHPGPAQGHQTHRALRDLSVLPKIHQGDGVQTHIAVVRDGQRQGELTVHHQVVVPLLDPHGGDLNLISAVNRQKPLGIPRLPEVPLLVQQRPRRRDLMLFHGPSPLSYPPIIL